MQDFTSWVCKACETPDVKRECCLCPVKGWLFCLFMLTYNMGIKIGKLLLQRDNWQVTNHIHRVSFSQQI